MDTGRNATGSRTNAPKGCAKGRRSEMGIRNWIIFLLLAPLAGLLQGMRRD